MTPELQKRAVEARKRKAAEKRALKAATFVCPPSKRCKKCGAERSIDCFPKHNAMRDGHLNTCKQCASQYLASWKRANPDKLPPKRPRRIPQSPRVLRRRYYEKHREERLAARKAYRLRNIEREKAREQRYLKANRTVVYAKNARRRAAETSAVPPWLHAIHKAQIQEFYDIALARSTQTGIRHHVDHIVPLRGNGVNGLHVPWNLQILTEFENCSKHNKLLDAGS
jgi:hypothetical protein